MQTPRDPGPPLRRCSAPATRRGFTLTELMVAITGGLLVSIAVFALARDSSRFYQRESRVGDATSGVVIGFQRLQADIARAGYLSSPNIQADPRLCFPSGKGPATFPAPLRDLAPIRIEPPESGFEPPQVFWDPSAGSTDAGPNGDIEPDTLTVMGSYFADEAFPISGGTESTTETGGTPTVTLQYGIGPLSRNGYWWADATQRAKILNSIFRPDRILRVIDHAGKHFYGIIAGATVATNGTPKIALKTTPRVLISTGTDDTPCRIDNTDIGTASVINVIRYELRAAKGDLATIPHLAALYPDLNATDAGTPNDLAPFEDRRADLVRVELVPTGETGSDVLRLADSTEVIAEHAVDLRAGVTVVTGINFQNNSAQLASNSLLTLPPGEANIASWAGAPDQGRTVKPDRIRSVRVRLSVRSPLPDRASNVDPDAGLGYRVFIPTPGNLPMAWARVRTLQADVALRNVEGALWP